MGLNCPMRTFWTMLLLVAVIALGGSARAAAACPSLVDGAGGMGLGRPDAVCVLTAHAELPCGPVAATPASTDASDDDGTGSDSERGSPEASIAAKTGFDGVPSDSALVHAQRVITPPARTTSPAQRPPRG